MVFTSVGMSDIIIVSSPLTPVKMGGFWHCRAPIRQVACRIGYGFAGAEPSLLPALEYNVAFSNNPLIILYSFSRNYWEVLCDIGAPSIRLDHI